MPMKPKKSDAYTDEQLGVMTVKELHAISHGTLGYKTLWNRLNGGWPIRQAVSQAAGNSGHRRKKTHPFKQFAPTFYSKGSTARAEEVERSW